MKQPVKSEVSNEDIMYLLQKVYEREDVLEKKFNTLEQKVDTLTTSVVNMAGDIKDIHTKMLGLPAFTY